MEYKQLVDELTYLHPPITLGGGEQIAYPLVVYKQLVDDLVCMHPLIIPVLDSAIIMVFPLIIIKVKLQCRLLSLSEFSCFQQLNC